MEIIKHSSIIDSKERFNKLSTFINSDFKRITELNKNYLILIKLTYHDYNEVVGIINYSDEQNNCIQIFKMYCNELYIFDDNVHIDISDNNIIIKYKDSNLLSINVVDKFIKSSIKNFDCLQPFSTLNVNIFNMNYYVKHSIIMFETVEYYEINSKPKFNINNIFENDVLLTTRTNIIKDEIKETYR